MKKQQVTEQSAARILETVQIFQTLAEVIKIEHHQDLFDRRFKNPAINQHASKIKESAQQIQIHLANIFKVKDKEYFSYEYATQVHRVIKHFVGMDIKQIEDFMDGVDELIEKFKREGAEVGES